MMLLIVLLVFSVSLNVALIVGSIFRLADRDMEILILKEKLRAE